MLDETIIGREIIEYDCVHSTNDTAKELAMRGCADGTVVMAHEQTGGRGQGEHAWYSATGKGLFFSVALRPKTFENIQLYSLLAGVALNSSLRSTTGVDTLIKWPNDIYYDGKKIAGILCEAGWRNGAVEYVIIGIGINITHTTDDFPEELRARAASLAMCNARTVDSKEIMTEILKQLDIWYKMTAAYGFDALATLYEAQKI